MRSDVRSSRLALGEGLFDQAVRRERMIGIEFWFQDEGLLKKFRLSKWKMALVSGVIILVLLNTIIVWLSTALSRLHFAPWMISFLSVGVLISLMTWIIMPWITRILFNFLR